MKYKINLLNPKEISFVDKVVYFSLNYLRYIIVITQLIIIFVFFYRFQLDQQIIDLKEAVLQKKEIIQAVLPLLKEAEILEKKQEAAKKILLDQEKTLSMFKYFLSIFPKGLVLKKMDLDKNGVKIFGTAIQLDHLHAFINLIKKEQKFKTVDLKSIKKTEFGYDFELNLSQFL
jgi:Tfp pilus assembly protein PilN